MKKIRPIVLALAIVAVAVLAYLTFLNGGIDLNSSIVTGGLEVLVCSVAFALLCVTFCFATVGGRLKPVKAFVKAASLFIWCCVAFLAASFVSSVDGMDVPRWLIYLILVLVAAVCSIIYLVSRRRNSKSVAENAIRKSAAAGGATKYTYSILYGSLIVMYAGSLFFIISGRCDVRVLNPCFTVTAALALWRVFKWRGILCIAVMSLVYCMIYGVVSTMSLYGLSYSGICMVYVMTGIFAIVSLSDFYTRKEENI